MANVATAASASLASFVEATFRQVDRGAADA
jgi:hypothetical protein